MNIEIKKILKQGEKKIVIIPKNSNFKTGDYVKISSLDNLQDRNEICKANKKLMENL